MRHWPSHKLTALASTLLALLTVTSAHAANECSLEYGFHIGGGAKQTLSTVIVNINAGEAKNINKAETLYAKNLSTHPVHVEFGGKPNASVTLNKDQRNPPVGSHPEAMLKTATCPAAVRATVVRDPAVAAPKLQHPTLAPGSAPRIK